MPTCPSCGAALVRVPRTAVERTLFGVTFRCRACDRRARRLHSRFSVRLAFVFSTHSRCLSCGTSDVRRTKRDRRDASRNGFNGLLRFLGAPLNSCLVCRTQYYDWRQPESRRRRGGDPTRASS